MRNQFMLCVLLLFMNADIQATMKQQVLLEVHIGMSEDDVRAKLQKIGQQQKEQEMDGDEGEQEVWMLDRDPRFDYLIARFDRQHRLAFMTAVVRKGLSIRYSDLADLTVARHATDGFNHTYSWTVPAAGKRAGYVLVARGTHPQLLTSYSLYPVRPRN